MAALAISVQFGCSQVSQDKLRSIEFSAKPSSVFVAKDVSVTDIPIQIDLAAPLVFGGFQFLGHGDFSTLPTFVMPDDGSAGKCMFGGGAWAGWGSRDAASQSTTNNYRGRFPVIFKNCLDFAVARKVISLPWRNDGIIEKHIGPFKIDHGAFCDPDGTFGFVPKPASGPSQHHREYSNHNGRGRFYAGAIMVNRCSDCSEQGWSFVLLTVVLLAFGIWRTDHGQSTCAALY